MSAPGSRLARQMRPHLGAGLWGEFVAHANRHYKARPGCAFAPASGVLRCVGALDGAPCAPCALDAVLVDLRAVTEGLDHTPQLTPINPNPNRWCSR